MASMQNETSTQLLIKNDKTGSFSLKSDSKPLLNPLYICTLVTLLQ